MRRMLTAALALLLILALCGCGKQDGPDISMYDLCKAMSSSGSFGDMKYASSEDSNAAELLANVSNLEYSKVRAFFIYYAAEGRGNADEIVVIRVRDSKDARAAEETLSSHLSKRKALYASYDKSQVPKLDKARVFRDGSFAVLIVSEAPETAEKAFREFIRK